MPGDAKLPVHGFVLAGGKSSRMGRDKALLPFRGRPMVETAVEKLRSFCSAVSIAGDRDDLSLYAPCTRAERIGCGPVGGIEAGLTASTQPWTLFLPVDVPLVPAEMLWRWAEATLTRGEAGCAVSALLALGERQPTFCMLRTDCRVTVGRFIDEGERRIWDLLQSIDNDATIGWFWPQDASDFAPDRSPQRMDFWFSNVNTPEELEVAELCVDTEEAR